MPLGLSTLRISQHVAVVTVSISVTQRVNCIVRLTGEGQTIIIVKWLDTGIYTRYISVTSQGFVLLIDEVEMKLNVYGADAILVRAITLPGDMKYPSHAVETSTGNFIISHGEDCYSRNRVCELTPDGPVIRSYCGQLVLGNCSELIVPRRIAVDGRGYMYVADEDKNRIVILDSAFNPCWIINPRDQVSEGVINALHFIKGTNQLLVGLSNGCILFYSVRTFFKEGREEHY